MPSAESPKLKFSCHHCTQVLVVKLSSAGKSGPCPNCRKMVVAPDLMGLPTGDIAEKKVREKSSAQSPEGKDVPPVAAQSKSEEPPTPELVKVAVKPHDEVKLTAKPEIEAEAAPEIATAPPAEVEEEVPAVDGVKPKRSPAVRRPAGEAARLLSKTSKEPPRLPKP